MIGRRLMAAAVAASVVASPTLAYGASASLPQGLEARASADLSDANALAGESTPVFLGLILVVLFAMVAVSGNGDGPDNQPTSP